jgi:hypothetical protein
MAGAFKIDDLPLGTYTLKTWHEKLGELSREITVKDTALEEIAFTYRRPTKKK